MKIQLKRSSVLDDGSAKKPLADQLEYGELAVNYAAADPTIFIKNSTNEVIAIAGANALASVPTLNSVTTEGNWSSSSLLVGGSPSDPNLELNNSGNVITGGYVRAEKATTTDAAFEVFLNDVQTFKVLGTGTIALGGTIDTTLDQSQANLVLNAESGKVTAISAETSGTMTSGGALTVQAGGADLTGTVNVNNSLNVTEGTALTGVVTMGSTLSVTDAVDFDSTLSVAGNSTFEETLTVNGSQDGITNTITNGTYTAGINSGNIQDMYVANVDSTPVFRVQFNGFVTAGGYDLEALAPLPA